VNLSLHEGEILGIAGVAGNGQSELVEVITGLRPCSGQIWLGGKDIANKPPAFSIQQGLAHIPEDRIGVGTAPNLSITSNIIMKRYDQEPVSQKWQLDYVAADDLASGLKTEYDIQAPNVHTQARKLSGGNLQKLILARELSSLPRLVVAMQPTRGLDVGAIEGVQQLLLNQRSQGCAILLVSEDLDELLSLSDRIAVMYEGEVAGVMCSEDFDITKIGLMMTGTTSQDLQTQKEKLSASNFDKVFKNLPQAEEPAQAGTTAMPELPFESKTQADELPQEGLTSPHDDPYQHLTEKERVLRKVLGEKYKQGDTE
jgi:simple sugar transport system ATP-binding protein